MNSIEERVAKSLEDIRPYLKADGGDISLVRVGEDMIAWVKLHGACIACDMSQMTMTAGVEEAVKRAVPEIVKVERVFD